MLISFGAKAQDPTFICSIANAKIVSDSSYEFDVMLQRTGNIELYLSYFQLGIFLNPAIIPAGAVVKVAPVEGSSALHAEQQPGPKRFSFDTLASCIRVVPVAPKNASAGTIISNADGGIRLIRMRVSCSKAFNKGVSTMHTWNFKRENGYPTALFARVGGHSSPSTSITKEKSFVISSKLNSDVTFK